MPLHYIGLTSVTSQEYFTLSLEEFIKWESEVNPYFIIHNAPFDVAVLRLRGAKIERYFDTQLAAAIWEGGSADNFKLETLGAKLGYPKQDLRQILIDRGLLDPKAPKGAEYYDKSEEMLEYLYFDLNATLAVFFHYLELYSTDELAWKYLINVEIPYIEIILEMQSGVLIDRAKLLEIKDTLKDDLGTSWEALQRVIGSTGVFIQFNGETWVPDLTKGGTVTYANENGHTKNGVTSYSHCNYAAYSPTNIQHNIYILEQGFNWVSEDITPSGNKKLDKKVLEKLESYGNEFAKVVLEYRLLYKLSTTFVEGIESATDPVTNVLNPEYCNICTRTHRLSSRNP